MAKVLLVGASNELKERKMGKLIDTFDIVARINQGGNSKCMNGEYKDIIGTRTDLWFCFHTGSFLASRQISYKYTEIFLKPEAYDKYNSRYTNITSFPNDVIDFTRNTLQSFNGFDSSFDVRRYNSDIKIDSWPTSGMLSLFYLIYTYENISVCGFDGFKTGHWYGNKFIQNQDESDLKTSKGPHGRHNGLLENEYFNYLKNAKVITVI